jgi:hypothetical protein
MIDEVPEIDGDHGNPAAVGAVLAAPNAEVNRQQNAAVLVNVQRLQQQQAQNHQQAMDSIASLRNWATN